MKIQNIEISNFKGIEHVSFDLSKNNVFCLSGENGKGKTSFLEAVNFLLTKNVPANFIRNNAGTTEVKGMVNGHLISRSSTAGENQVENKLNGIKCTGVDINRVLENGAKDKKLDTALNIVSSKVFEDMSAADLADFLLSYINEKPSLDTIISYMDSPSQDAIDYLKEHTEQNEFSLDDIKKLHKEFYSTRTGVNKLAKQKVDTVEKPENSMEEINKRLEEITKQEAAYMNFIKLAKNYNLALGNKLEYEKQLTKLEEELKKAENVISVEKELSVTKKEIGDLDKDIQNMMHTVVTLETNISMYEKTVASLKSSSCPFSDKVVCTTDKQPIIQEIMQLSEQNRKEVTRLKGEMEKKTSEKVKKESLLTELQLKDKHYSLKKQKEKQLADMKQHIPQMPEKPQEVVKPDSQAEKEKLNNMQKQIILYNRMLEQQKTLENAKKEQKILDYLVHQLESKGPVCRKVVEYYISIFDNTANKTAALLAPDMKIKFAANNGIKYFVKVNAQKKYMPYQNLSGGEKVLALMIIIDVINQLSGSNIMVLDELSVLDEENFRELMSALQSDYIRDRYDAIFLAMTPEKEKYLPSEFQKLIL